MDSFTKQIQEQINAVKSTAQFMSDALQEQKKATQEALVELKKLDRDYTSLKKRIESLEDKLYDQEQKERNRNLVIVGIPKQTEDSAKEILIKVFQYIKGDIKDEEVKDSYRIGKQQNAPILVKFFKQEIKTKAIQSVKRIKGIKVNECGLPGKQK